MMDLTAEKGWPLMAFELARTFNAYKSIAPRLCPNSWTIPSVAVLPNGPPVLVTAQE